MPVFGQESRAMMNASCIASSARSNDPESRINVAMIRPRSSRNTDSAVAEESGMLQNGRFLLSGSEWNRGYRTKFDADCTACLRESRRPVLRFYRILAVDDPESPQG